MQLPWNQHYPAHPLMPTILQLPYSLADEAAKEATTIAANTILLVSFSSSIQVINEMGRDDPPTHKRVELIYQHQKASRDSKEIENRKGDILFGRLRSGRHSSLHQYLHRLDPFQDPICPKCRHDKQDLHHWLCECPEGDAMRQQHLKSYRHFDS